MPPKPIKSLKVTAEMHQLLKIHAAEKGVSISELVEGIVRKELHSRFTELAKKFAPKDSKKP